jgi:glucose-6-phosphate 1-dehydrogenase
VEWSWKVVDPILRQFSLEQEFIQSYRAGSWGRKKRVSCLTAAIKAGAIIFSDAATHPQIRQ